MMSPLLRLPLMIVRRLIVLTRRGGVILFLCSAVFAFFSSLLDSFSVFFVTKVVPLSAVSDLSQLTLPQNDIISETSFSTTQ